MTRLHVGTAAPDTRLQHSDGTEVQLASVWQQRPVLLTFLRHFG